MKQMNNDNKLITRLTAEEPDAQREIIRLFRSRLFMYFRMRIKGEQNYEDLVQDTLASFFEAIGKDKIIEDKFIAPFIFGVAKRVMYNYFYKKKRNGNIQRKGEEQAVFSYDFDEDERMSNESIDEIIQACIRKNLSKMDRIILKEFYLNENDLDDVAALLGKTKHYISVRKERALKKIKNEILKLDDIYIY
jgi:RNA polymerase sigma factor (sigma-70 family)